MSRVKALWSEFKSFAFKGNMIDLAVAVVIGGAFSGVITAVVADIIMPGISYVVTGAQKTAEGVSTAAEQAKKAVGLPSSKPSTGPSTQPSTQPSTEPSTQPATQPVAAAQATAGPGAAPPVLLEKIGALENEVAQLKAAAAAPPPPAADKVDTKAVDFTWKIGRFKAGDFVGQIINFLLVAFAVFIFIVKLLGTIMKRAGGTPAPSEPTTRECPLCLSVIPIKAKRCAHCTADLTVPA
jgi:large-conductance mechanosensitive channel